ncbi:MAG: type II toxin-antitoxin system RelE/ParE family toxin [Verrucomicrobiota bacterium]|nr:type II toxin-antitoxin system RelE/ParE family toxin [Verrucomicrobiota bacterium]
MDRKLVWTEKASSDIEAIVRYIARRDSKAASRIGLGIYDRAQILLEHPEAGTILDELRDGGWRKLIFRRWKSFTRFAATPSSSAEYGLRH